MSKEYGYIGKEVTQAFRDNKGIFSVTDVYDLDQDNKWTNLAIGQLELIETKTISDDSSVSFQNLELNSQEVQIIQDHLEVVFLMALDFMMIKMQI